MARQTALPPRPPCQLYLITPPAIADLEAFAGLLEQALSAGPVAALQIRLKDMSDEQIKAAVVRLARPAATASMSARMMRRWPRRGASWGRTP